MSEKKEAIFLKKFRWKIAFEVKAFRGSYGVLKLSCKSYGLQNVCLSLCYTLKRIITPTRRGDYLKNILNGQFFIGSNPGVKSQTYGLCICALDDSTSG